MSADIADELSRLAESRRLDAEQCSQLRSLLDLLACDELAPTSVRSPHLALEVHLADSLSALDFDVMRGATTIADIGSGAGFPGLPLAVALPNATLRLVESQNRKCSFIEAAVQRMKLANVEVVHRRAEAWTEGLAMQDLVLARAVAPQSVVLEYAAPLLRERGALLDWRGRREDEAERASSSAAKELGMSLVEVRRTEPYPGARDHHLHLYIKVEDTPELFPRRPGMARKRPLGRPC